MHKCAGLSIPKSIFNYCLIDFRYKEKKGEKKKKEREKNSDILYIGRNSCFLSERILEQYQNSLVDKTTVNQYAFCSVLSLRSRSLLLFLFYFPNVFC